MISFALLREQLKRFWGISALGFAAYFFAVYNWVRGWFPSASFVIDVLHFDVVEMHIILWVLAFLAAFCATSFQTNAKAAMFFRALPISKNKLIFTNAFAGIILVIFPVFLLCVLLAVTSINVQFCVTEGFLRTVRGVSTEIICMTNAAERVPLVAGLFAKMALFALYFFGVFWFIMSLAGHKVAAVGLAVAFPFTPIAVETLFHFIARIYLFGFSGWHFFDFYYALARLNPSIALARQDFDFRTVATFVALGLAMYVGAFVINRLRRVERAGDMFAFKWLKLVMVFLGAVAAMVFGGLLAVNTIFSGVGVYVSYVIGFVIGFFIAWIIAEKSFLILHKVKLLPHFCAAAVGLYALMLFVMHIGMGFWINHIPPPEQVESVSFSWVGSRALNVPFLSTGISTADPEIIMKIQDAHRVVLAERRFPHRTFWQFNVSWDFYYVSNNSFVSFWYRLVDWEGTVERVYVLPQESAALTALEDIIYSDEIIIHRHQVLQNRHAVTIIAIYFGDSIYPVTIITDSNRVEILMDAVTEGIITDTRRIRTGEIDIHALWNFDTLSASPRISFSHRLEDAEHSTIIGGVFLFPDSKSSYLVMNLLDEWGYLD